MTRIQRRLLIDTSVIGIALTAFVAFLDLSTRALTPLDDWFYDRRARLCQYFTPAPTDKLVHVDIDDASIEAIGHWPWPRTQLAEIIDEIELAGAKAIATDVIFSDPVEPRLKKLPGGGVTEIDDDANFASAVRRGGNFLVPISLELPQSASPLYKKIRDYLLADLELTEADCYKRLLADPSKVLPMGSKFPADLFIAARREAMNSRIARELEQHGDLSVEQLRMRLLPKTDPTITGSPRFNVLNEQYRKVVAVKPLTRFMLPIPADAPPLAEFPVALAPLPELTKAAALSGYVNYLQKDEAGIIRSIPLFVNYRGSLFPQMDLTLACAVLGVDVNSVRLEPGQVVIPRPPNRDADIVIPVRRKYSATFGRDMGTSMDIPFRGSADWNTIYDHKRYEKPELHISTPFIWEARSILERIARNNASIDRAISTILDDDQPWKLRLDPEAGKKYATKLPPPHDTAGRRAIVEWTRTQLKESGYLDLLKSADPPATKPANTPPNQPTTQAIKVDPKIEEERRQRQELEDANNVLTTVLDQNQRFEQILSDRRAQLRSMISGRAVLIGWVASGGIDAYPTPIQPICPGVVIHGIIFNAIMTGEFWHRAPAWVTFAITVLIGLLVTAANGFLKPSGALIAAIALGAVYLFVNGLLLFDYGNWCVGVAGPMVALASVWSTGTLASFLIESRERTRITKRFSSYVDQKLVNYVIEHPDVEFNGQVREMSVVFTDLAGFTTLSEQLRERTVPILSKYLSVMVPVIRRNNGYVNKFLGDGIMCFYNAPDDDLDHAAHAVQTVLEMQVAMKAFADELVAEGLPRVAMRCGVATGTMVVGDSGPSDASDYTVLGDTVNFASRLEGANKAVGTSILISHRTTELLGDSRFLLRPVGKLLVVGKSEGVMTYEPLAPFDDATPQDMVSATMSTEMIASYFAKDFAKCIEFADKMDAQIGATKLPGLYRKAALKYIETPPGAEFQGNLILTEK